MTQEDEDKLHEKYSKRLDRLEVAREKKLVKVERDYRMKVFNLGIELGDKLLMLKLGQTRINEPRERVPGV